MDKRILVQNGKTEYVILVPENSDTYIDFAVKTLNDVIEKSTGVRFDIVTDAKDKKFISLGKTHALEKICYESTYGVDGFSAIEKDGNLYLFGQSDYGPIWGVYALLEDKVGYKFFTPDEIKIEKREVIDIAGFDVTYTPTISNRCSGFGLAKYDLEYATGLKAYAWYGQRLDGKYFWGSWAHNHVQVFINPKKYYKDHPEWFVQEERFYRADPEEMMPRHMQLCLSNMEMRDEFFKNLIESIKENDHATHFLIGREDNDLFCRCPNCQKYIDKIGESGLHMHFINDMARRVEKWRLENAPSRTIYIGGFAYAYDSIALLKAPVVRVNGELVPLDACVVAEPNVFIMFAPMLSPDHSKPITDELNTSIRLILEKWKSICDRVTLWFYYGSFRRKHEFTDGIYRFREDVKFFEKMGCDSFYVECPSIPGSISFQAMHLWVLTQVEWNKDLDTDDLIKEFMTNYYKEASPHMLDYFYYLINHFAKVRERYPYLTGKKYHYGMTVTDTIPQFFWDLNTVYDASRMLDKAEEAIKSAGYDKEMEEKLLGRIDDERMTMILVQLEYFNKETSNYDEKRTVNAYPKERIYELCDEFEKKVKKYGYDNVSGDHTVAQALQTWRDRACNAGRSWQDRIDAIHKKLEEASKE